MKSSWGLYIRIQKKWSVTVLLMAYCPIHCPVKYLWDSGNQLLNEGFHALAVLLSHKMALTLSI